MPHLRALAALTLLLAACAAAPTTASDTGGSASGVEQHAPDTGHNPVQPATSTSAAPATTTSVSTTPASTIPASTTPSTSPPRSLTVVAGGDVLNEGWVDQAGRLAAGPGERFDFAPLFEPVAPIISAADLAICHAELPIGRADQASGVYGRSPFGGNLLLAPFEIAEDLATTGFDRCSTSSNHAFDLGTEGIVSTLDALAAAGLGAAGTARTADESAVALFEVNAVRVAHLSATRNWNTVPPERWMLSRADPVDQLLAAVDDIRTQGAELVILSLHVGKELLAAPTDGDRAFVTELTARTRIDLVVMHGPHVVQPYELVNGTPVYWSLGNFVSGMGRAGTGRYEDRRTLDGLLATVRFTETAPGRFSAETGAVLICNELHSRVVRAPIRELASSAATTLPDDLRTELQDCIDRTLPVVGDVM